MISIIFLNLLFTAYTFDNPRPFLCHSRNLLEMMNEFFNLEMSIAFILIVMVQNDPKYLNDIGIGLNTYFVFIMTINVVVVLGTLISAWAK